MITVNDNVKLDFIIFLDTGEKYFISIKDNFKKYKIKRGNLYKGLKKLGKIKSIKEYRK